MKGLFFLPTDDGWMLVIYIIVFVVLLYLVYLTTRLVGSKVSGTMKGKHMHVVETISLGMDKRIHLIKAGKEYILVSSTSKELNYLTSVKLDQADLVKESTTAEENASGFNLILAKYIAAFIEKSKKIHSVNINNDTGETGDISETGEIGDIDNNSCNSENIHTKSVFKDNLNKLRSVMAKNIIGDGMTNDKKEKPG